MLGDVQWCIKSKFRLFSLSVLAQEKLPYKLIYLTKIRQLALSSQSGSQVEYAFDTVFYKISAGACIGTPAGKTLAVR